MIVFSLKYKDRLFYQMLPPGKKVTFGSGQKDTVRVMDMAQSQISLMLSGNTVSIQAPRFNQNNVPLGTPVRLDAATGCSVYLSNSTGTSSKQVKLPYDGILKVGRSDGNDVILGLPFVSGRHFQLRISGGNIRVEDQGSTNGLYLNGQKISAAVLRSGDILNILTVRIRLNAGCLEFENVGNLLKVRSAGAGSSPSSAQVPPQQKYLHYRRSPRIQEQLPHQCIVLDNPPRKGQDYEPKGGRVMSAISGAAGIGANVVMAAASPSLAAARSIYLVPQTINFIYNLFNGGKMEKERQQKLETYIRQREDMYKQYIADQQAKIISVANEQRKIITHDNPDPQQWLRIASNLERRLWERMPSDRDFLDIRLGMGYEPLCVDIKSRAEMQGFRMEDDELEELCAIIAEENRIVDNVPARVPLRQCSTIGVVGDRRNTIHLVRNILVSLTAQHCHQDVRVVGIFDEAERGAWASMRWLPHVWDENRQFRFLSFDSNRAHNICELLADTFKKRQTENSVYSGEKQQPVPHYVLILGSRAMVEQEALMRLLTQNDPSMGVTAIFLFDDVYYLPTECRFIIDLDIARNGGIPCAYDKAVYNKKFTFSPDHSVSSSQFSDFCRRLAAIELEDFKTEHILPGSITFLQGYGVKTVEQLGVVARWRSRQRSNTLEAPIGVLANGKTFSLDIHQDAHGPHGLVAGTTGSGKSELLQTWLLSLAVNYHPHDVNFIIIDYKGGGLANLLEPLPHMVGKITNIGTNIARSLISLKAELHRREKLLSEYGVNSVEKYQRLYKSGNADIPMPRLIIVADEFAELQKEEQEFMRELSSFARVGRSLGIHLILATQKPGGVINDQIDSNSRFRICMKVNDITDSRDMIKRPDAAKITQPGRAYIRVGEDEMFELFQSFWSGAEYAPDQGTAARYTNQVRIVDVDGQRLQTVREEKIRNTGSVDEMTAVVRYICKAAEAADIRKLQGLWLPELPDWIALRKLQVPEFFDGRTWESERKGLRIPIGLFDRPAQQQQGVQYIDFARQGHYGIYGSAGTGKTTLLKTILLSLGLCYTPEDVNIFAIDCGGRSTSIFADMSHTVSIALDGEVEKVQKIVDYINREMEYRKSLFQKHSIGSFTVYREYVGKDLPAIVIAIDNLLSAYSYFEVLDGFLSRIANDGPTHGIYLVFTANSTSGLKYNMVDKIKNSIAFELADSGAYGTILGRLAPGTPLPATVGRALISERPPVTFQAAVYTNQPNEHQGAQELQDLFVQMKQAWHGARISEFSAAPPSAVSAPHIETAIPPASVREPSKKVGFMPDSITVEELAPHYQKLNLLPLGMDYGIVEPACVDLSDDYSMVICHSGGATDTLLAIARMLLTKQNNRLFLFDGALNGLSALEDRAAFYAPCTNADKVDAAVEQLVAECERRSLTWTDFDSHAGSGYIQNCILIDDVTAFALADGVSNESRDMLERLCRKARGLGFVVIATGAADQLQKYCYQETLTQAVLAPQKGLILSGTPASHSYLCPGVSAEEKYMEPAPQDGLIVENGKVRRILRMQ